MTIGQRILQARQAAGLSQRALAGTEITRNMLSALEHDAANPSVATLRYLSERLGRPVSYFLGEDNPGAAGWETLVQARSAFEAGEFRRCRELLWAEPGEVLEREWRLLDMLSLMREAEQAIAEKRLPYARELLHKAGEKRGDCPYFGPELERKYRILLARCPESVGALPGLAAEISEDEALLLRAESALADGTPEDARRYLLALDARDAAWYQLMGEVHFRLGQYRQAAECYHRAEDAMDLRERLEICYRELEDYKMAYFYAKKL